MRWEAERLGFEKMKLKNGTMKAYVTIENNNNYFQSSIFGKILAFIQKNGKICQFQEIKGQMVISFSAVPSIKEGLRLLQSIQ